MRFSRFVNFLLLLSFSLAAAAATNAAQMPQIIVTQKSRPCHPSVRQDLKESLGNLSIGTRYSGRTFIHTHHYCSGLAQINRYYRARTRQQKTYSLQGANGALSYMVSHASPSYSLMPDVYLKSWTRALIDG